MSHKKHGKVDRKHKLVRRRYHVTDAALHDSQAVDHLWMQGNTGAAAPCPGDDLVAE